MSDEVRPLPIFADQSIRDAIERELAMVPDGHVVAFVAHADPNGALAVMVLVDGAWSFGGYLKKEYHGEIAGGAELRWSR